MEACEVVRLFVNKAIVPAEPKRRGNPGYGRVKALRVLVYARLKGLDNDTRIVEHLKKHPWIAKTLGLGSCTRQNYCWQMVETLPKPSRRDFHKDSRYASTCCADNNCSR